MEKKAYMYYDGDDKEEMKQEKKKKKKVLPRFELGSWDSESQVLTVTPQNHAVRNCEIF